MRPALARAILLLSAVAPLPAQMIDRCSPGWSLLNQLREQLTPETSQETLGLLQVSITKRLENCRGVPDLWYYRALVGERLHDLKDAAYARKQAAELGSEALAAKLNPFETAPAATVKLSAAIHEKYALVVGINQFQNVSGLRFAVADAKGVADLLTNPEAGRFPKSNVTLLADQDATLLGVKTAIGKIRAQANADDLVLIYVASHGSPRGDDPNGVSYIYMNDTKPDNLFATSLQMIELVDTMRRDLRAKRVVLILDTCYSGDATASRGVRVHTASQTVGPATEFSVAADRFDEKTPDGAARIVISASRADETSLEDSRTGHGYFTSFLLAALRENSGANPLRDVFKAVHDHTLQAVREQFPGHTQTPTLRGTPAGLDLVLGAPVAQ